MDSGLNVVSSSAFEGREAVVDHQKAGESRISANAGRGSGRHLNWVEIFRNRPDLSPPGYEQAMLAANEKTRLKKQRAAEVAAEKVQSKRGGKKKR